MDKKNLPDEDLPDEDRFEREVDALDEYFRIGGHEKIGDGCYRKNIRGQD